MMRWIKSLALLCLLVLGAGALKAQETGQICILSFDDRNQNGARDAGEPPITQGIGIHLLNTGSVTIESTLLEESPNAARGLACFDGLPAGDYIALLTSADYIAMTSSSFDAAVAPGAAPVRFDFGVKPLTSRNSTAMTSPAISADVQNQTLQRILFGTVASVIVGGLMFIIGLFIYFAGLRPRMKRALALQARAAALPPAKPPDAPRDSDPGPAVELDNRLLGPEPHHLNKGSPLLFNEEDTDRMGAV